MHNGEVVSFCLSYLNGSGLNLILGIHTTNFYSFQSNIYATLIDSCTGESDMHIKYRSEDGGYMFCRKFGSNQTHTMLQPRRRYTSDLYNLCLTIFLML
jgi:hypothetical protein